MKHLQAILLAAMMTCLTVPIILLGEALFKDWSGQYILALVPLIVLEGIWSKRIYQRERLSGTPLAWRLMAEGVILLLFLKLSSYLGHGYQPFLDDLRSWVRAPITFITMDFMLLAPLVLTIWSASQKFQSDLKRLSDPLETGKNRQSARESIRAFVLFGGFGLLLLTGILLGFAKEHFSLSRTNSMLLEAAVICYLGLSLLLLAYMQYLRRYIEWQLEGLSVPDEITHRWAGWGFTLVIGIFLIAAFLPAVYRYGPEQLIVRILELLLYVGQLLITLLMFLFTPMIWALSLLDGNGSKDELPQVELPEAPPPSIDQIPLWWINLRYVLQYIIILTLLGIIFITYLRNRAIKLPQLTNIPQFIKQQLHNIWLWIKGLLNWVKADLKGFRTPSGESSQVVQKRIEEKWYLFKAFTARARIRRYYFSLLRRTSESGYQRAPQQTPKEYAVELTSKFHDQQGELAVLTDAFTHARYDNTEVHEEEIPPVRKAWYAIRKMLRKSHSSAKD
jgi:hypothetical protein